MMTSNVPNSLKWCNHGFKRVFIMFTVLVIVTYVYLWKTSEHIHTRYALNSAPIHNSSLNKEQLLIVLVLSRRDAFQSRETIRNTWSRGQTNIFFMVGEKYCIYPPEERVPGACQFNGYSVSTDNQENYRLKEELKTARLRKESQVVLLSSVIDNENLSEKLREAYKWALSYSNASWIVHVFDDSFVRVQLLKSWLVKMQINQTIIGPGEPKCISKDQLFKINIFPNTSFSLASDSLMVSKSVAKYLLEDTESAEYDRLDRKFSELCFYAPLLKPIFTWTNSDIITKNGNCFNISKLIISHGISDEETYSCYAYPESEHTFNNIKGKGHHNDYRKVSLEMPEKYITSNRFDIIIKSVYAYFYSRHGFVPQKILDAYIELIRVCKTLVENEKTSIYEVVNGFHETIESNQNNEFVLIQGRAFVYPCGYPGDDTHRIAAAIALSKDVNVGYKDQNLSFSWSFLLERGYSIDLLENVLLEWMNIQRELSNVREKILILTIFANKTTFNDQGYQIFKKKCSLDKGIVYEKSLNVNRQGLTQLIRHMYGSISWIQTRINVQVSQMTSPKQTLNFIFFFAKSAGPRRSCKARMRELYYPPTENSFIFKSTLHIPDYVDQQSMIAEMILNKNSVEFLNYADNGQDCQLVAEDIAQYYNTSEARDLPQIYPSRDDVMIDLDFVLHMFNLSHHKSVELLFLSDRERKYQTIQQQIKSIKYNLQKDIFSARSSRRGHNLNQNVTSIREFFYDPVNYGFCYGIKFVSLKQLLMYKMTSNESNGSQDVKLIRDLLGQIEKEALQQF